MNMLRTVSMTCIAALAVSTAGALRADDRVTCESKSYRYTSCAIPQAGYVTLTRQISRADCVRGRTWDFDRREIWVDDGCAAEFNVDTSSHSHNHGSSDGAKVAGAVVGLAVLGALINNANHKDDDRYHDDDYYGSRHSSYVPGWMQGRFEGYNPQYDANVTLTIDADGCASARTGGRTIDGWVNNGELHVGDTVFDIDQTREGFVTSQVGAHYNEVQYRRSR